MISKSLPRPSVLLHVDIPFNVLSPWGLLPPSPSFYPFLASPVLRTVIPLPPPFLDG